VVDQGLALDGEVDGHTDGCLDHQQLFASNLREGSSTESRSEIIFDLRYSLKRAGSNNRYYFCFMACSDLVIIYWVKWGTINLMTSNL
jgi:hypothetical protein